MPDGVSRHDREPQLPVDIYDPTQTASLVRFALASQIDKIGKPGAQGKVAKDAGLTPSIMTRLIRPDVKRPGSLTSIELSHLVDAQDALVARLAEPRLASLVAFHARLFPQSRSDVMVPARWAEAVSKSQPRSAIEVILRGEAALALTRIRGAAVTSEFLSEILDRLLVLGGSPSREGIEALRLVARLADQYLPRRTVFQRIEVAMKSNPTGFRAWRAVSLILRLHGSTNDPQKKSDLIQSVQKLYGLKRLEAHPSRSLDLEAAATTPGGADWEWATTILASEPRWEETTPRRLGYAALAYWQRLLEADGSKPDPSKLRPFQQVAAASSSETHLGWVSRNLADVMAGAQIDEIPTGPELELIRTLATDILGEDLTTRISGSAQDLLVHGILSNHGLARRHALDALRTAMLGDRVCRALNTVVDDQLPAWLSERASFAIGFLGSPSEDARDVLQRVLSLSPSGPDGLGAVEAAAWSVGELWARYDDDAVEHKWVSEYLVPLLKRHNTANAAERRVSRAACYSLALAAPHGAREALDTAQSELKDPIARRFARLGVTRVAGSSLTPIHEFPLSISDPRTQSRRRQA